MRTHATVVAIGGRGVMLTGPSGSGKSDLALRLIDRGAILVGDDYVDLFVEGARLFARPVETIAGRLEIRDVGLVDFACLERAPIALGFDLAATPERLPEPARREILGVDVAFVAIAPFAASAPLKVEQALTLYGLPLEPASR